MEKIIAGIQRFQQEAYPERKALFDELATGQSPEVLFITCADSRIDPNLITSLQVGLLDGTLASGGNRYENDQVALWDAGTEVDQPVGEGPDQAPRQDEAGQGDPDPDDTVREVSEAAGLVEVHLEVVA